jgi:hypothetical protein
MSESFYYYQKVGFLVHEDIDDGLRLLLRCILPFTLPIVFLLVFVFQEIALLLIGIVVPILLEIWERFFNKTIDQGEIVFYDDRIKITSNTINMEASYDQFKDMKIVINEYEGQKTGRYSSSLGYNNRMNFTYESEPYEFEVILLRRNIEFIYENRAKWNRQFGVKITLKNYTDWRFLRFFVRYYS